MLKIKWLDNGWILETNLGDFQAPTKRYYKSITDLEPVINNILQGLRNEETEGGP